MWLSQEPGPNVGTKAFHFFDFPGGLVLHGDTVQVCSGPLSPAGLLPTKSLASYQIALQRWAHCRGDI